MMDMRPQLIHAATLWRPKLAANWSPCEPIGKYDTMYHTRATICTIAHSNVRMVLLSCHSRQSVSQRHITVDWPTYPNRGIQRKDDAAKICRRKGQSFAREQMSRYQGTDQQAESLLLHPTRQICTS